MTSEGLKVLDSLLEKHLNGGHWQFQKALKPLAEELGLADVLCVSDRRAWDRRTHLLLAHSCNRSFAQARRAQIKAAADRARYPSTVWIYRDHECPDHFPLNGLVLPPSHEFWRHHVPPNSWYCRCSLYPSHLPRSIERLGGKVEKQMPPDWNSRSPNLPFVEPIFENNHLPTTIEILSAIASGELTDFRREDRPI